MENFLKILKFEKNQKSPKFAESTTFNPDFQPFLMPTASVSNTYQIEANLEYNLSEKKGKKIMGPLVKKWKN